jgi:hypothetical protein
MITERQEDGSFLSEQRLATGKLLLCEADSASGSKTGLIVMIGENRRAKKVEFIPAEPPPETYEVFVSDAKFKSLFGDRE